VGRVSGGSARPLRVLLVSYQFPPVGGAGVGRVLKLAKYLPAHGVRPSVLTVRNPSVPVLDRSLEKDVAPGLLVSRVRTLEPRYGLKREGWSSVASRRYGVGAWLRGVAVGVARHLLVPDAQVLWQPGAHLALARILRREKSDVVFISGPPFSQFMLAPAARLLGAAVVLDYRDEWSTYRTSFEMMSPAGAAVGAHLEGLLLRRVDAVTTATEAFRQNLLARFPFLRPDRVRAVPNGYDPDDFPPSLPKPPSDRFVLTYAGTVFKLTSARSLLGGLRRLHEAHPDLARLLDVRFFGRIVETEMPHFEGSEALGVRRVGYVDHDAVISRLAESHMVLCLLADEPGTKRIYPSKIFELMYLGRPVLTLAPEGELVALARQLRLGPVLPPHDEATIAECLVGLLREFCAGRPPRVDADRMSVARYDRRVLAGEFADLFRCVASRHGKRPDAARATQAGA
jgi:glycosyltransferase involved in cell wall biosynthesis